MLTLLRNGGYLPMLFILLTGLVGLGAAFHFAVRARRETLGFVKWMAAATLFGTLAATCADVGATLYAAEKQLRPRGAVDGPGGPGETNRAGLPDAVHYVIGGFAESTSPGILGFSFLAVTAMLVAVGRRRLDARG